jgi:hypothetical protein
VHKKLFIIAVISIFASSANAQAWRNCIPGSIGPGECDSIGPGGGLFIGPIGDQSIGPDGGLSIGPSGDQSIGPDGGLSIGPGGDQSIGPDGGLSIGPGGGQSIGPGGGQSLGRDRTRGLNTQTTQPFNNSNGFDNNIWGN